LTPRDKRPPTVQAQVIVVVETTSVNAVVKTIAMKELVLSKAIVIPEQIIILIVCIGQAELIG
jgi:hypothetical protein